MVFDGITLWSNVILLAFLLRLAWIDAQEFRLPDTLTLPLVLIGLALSLAGAGPAPADAAIGAAVGYLVFRGLGAAYFAIRRVDGLGLGDAKLMAAAGAWLGWQMLPYLALLASLAALAFVLITGHGKQDKIAFGVFLCLGFAVLRFVPPRVLF